MMYHVPNSSGEGTLALVDDWDLDAALQQFKHSMKITIQTSDGITNSGRLYFFLEMCSELKIVCLNVFA